mmetsp:Transcript_6327/g.10347  ORF Transcript_6327/g.10347 Transcript_6327/m.10347 type:complete len:885 (+) Transcript_6327:82-2736(+)
MQRLCLLAIGLIVLTSAVSDLNYFEAAFGQKTHVHHAAAVSRKHELFALAHQKASHRILKLSHSGTGSNVEEKPGYFLGCADLTNADAAMFALQSEYGNDNVRIVVSDSKSTLAIGGLTCFLVHPEKITADLLQKKSYLLAWYPVSPSFKISAAAHSQLETLLTVQKSNVKSEVVSPSTSPHSSDSEALMNLLKLSELEIHLHSADSGSGGGNRRAHSTALGSSILQKLMTQTPTSMSNTVNDFSTAMPHVQAWSQVASELRDVSTKKHVRSEIKGQIRHLATESPNGCNFDKLVFSSHDEFLFITHMHELADPSCFATVLATTAAEPDVISISHTETYRPLLDLVGDLLHSGDPAEGRVYHDVGLTGNGIIVGLLDGGIDEYSCFFNNSDGQTCARSLPGSPTHDLTRRKVIQYTYDSDSIEDEADGHGTGMAGILCGESLGGGHSEHLGVAPGAKIAFYDASTSSANIGPLSDNLDTYFDVAATTGAKLYSASWGNRYDNYVARDVINDQYAVDNDFLLIAAVGNYQASINNKVFSPGMSKNALTVGSSGTSGDSNPNSLSYFSCTGPTDDGRFGVDVLGHGVDVFAPKSSGSTAETCEISSRTGTSSATAAISGAAALVQEFFKNSAFWAASCNSDYAFCSAGATNPKAILLKTILIHSGQDVGNSLAYPGNEQGFGRVQLDEVLVYSGVTTSGLDLFIEEATLSQNDVLNWTVVVTSNTIPLKATIAWVDPANIVSASKQLLNDVDLRIVSPSGTITYGNGNSAGDSHNNAEMARIASPTPGIYTVSVSVGALGSGSSQAVSLVITSYGTVGDVPEPTGSPSVAPTHQPNYNRPSQRPVFVYYGGPAPTPVPAPSPVAAPVVATPSVKAPTVKPTINYSP